MSSVTEIGRSIFSRYLASLQYQEYRKLWFASLFSQSSAWALIVARAALVLQMTTSATWVGSVTFAAMIPSVLMSPISGFLADRFDRRTVLLYAYSLNLAHNIVLAILVVTDTVVPWHLIVLAVINGSARSSQMPPAQALLANTIPRERLSNAVFLYQATLHGSRFLGPLLILIVLWATMPQSYVFFVPVLLYAVGLVLIMRIRLASTGTIEAGRSMGVFLGNIAAGAKFIYRNPLVVSMMLLVVAHCAMTMSFESLFPVLSRDKLDLTGGIGILGGASYLMVGYGLGALVTTLGLAGVRSESIRGNLFFWLAVISGVTPLLLAWSPNLTWAMISAAGMGISQGGFMALGSSILQSIATDASRGRLMGVYTLHITGFMASFNLVNGALADIGTLTASLILGAGGVSFIVVVVFSFVRVPLRQLYLKGVPAT